MINVDNNKLNRLLELTVGTIFGATPADNLDQIKQLKFYESQRIRKCLLLKKSDTVIDLGSGPGFIADCLAGEVDHIHCVDINDDFLELSKNILKRHTNITYHLNEPGKLNTLPSVSAIYASSVFVQFDYYDIYQYLIECHKILNINGRMIFNIVNDDHLDMKSAIWQNQNRVRQANSHECVIQYNNKNVINRMIRETGFDLIKTFDDKQHTFFIIIKK